MTSLASDHKVDVASIERQLAELWRAEKHDGERAVTRAALWNVVAHTWDGRDQSHATEVLARASAKVPQRTIVVKADPHGASDIESWISANCHLVGGGRQVCSEEVVIVAAGERVGHIPPLVSALLLPDMPVAVWWLGDLPHDREDYVDTLLGPADRLIVDSAHFNSASDLDVVWRIIEETTTAPADLNWARLDEWRVATAALFDPQPMRERLRAIRHVKVFSGGDESFGATSEALLYVAWLIAQTGTEMKFEFARRGDEPGICEIELHFDDTTATVRQDRRALAHEIENLIVRLLKYPEADRVYLKTLNIARRLAA